jgi:hypothetical protein
MMANVHSTWIFIGIRELILDEVTILWLIGRLPGDCNLLVSGVN